MVIGSSIDSLACWAWCHGCSVTSVQLWCCALSVRLRGWEECGRLFPCRPVKGPRVREGGRGGLGGLSRNQKALPWKREAIFQAYTCWGFMVTTVAIWSPGTFFLEKLKHNKPQGFCFKQINIQIPQTTEMWQDIRNINTFRKMI